jgi:parallel beta-helix repeat protein
LYDSSHITVSANHVGNTQGAIGMDADGEFFCEGSINQGASCTGPGDPTCTGVGGTCTTASADDETIENNVVYGSLVYDAIDVCGSNGTTVTANTVSNSGQSAIHLDSTCALDGGPVGGTATVSGNILNEACAGILNGSAGNTIGTNTSNNVANTNPRRRHSHLHSPVWRRRSGGTNRGLGAEEAAGRAPIGRQLRLGRRNYRSLSSGR